MKYFALFSFTSSMWQWLGHRWQEQKKPGHSHQLALSQASHFACLVLLLPPGGDAVGHMGEVRHWKGRKFLAPDFAGSLGQAQESQEFLTCKPWVSTSKKAMISSAMRRIVNQKYPEHRKRQNWPLRVGMSSQGWDSPRHCRYVYLSLCSQARFINRRNVYIGHH